MTMNPRDKNFDVLFQDLPNVVNTEDTNSTHTISINVLERKTLKSQDNKNFKEWTHTIGAYSTVYTYPQYTMNLSWKKSTLHKLHKMVMNHLKLK